jgi:hypothetical protein
VGFADLSVFIQGAYIHRYIAGVAAAGTGLPDGLF